MAASAAPVATIAVPEALVAGLRCLDAAGDAQSDLEIIAELMDGVACVCLGPGLANEGNTSDLVTGVLGLLPKDSTCLIDAVALSCLPNIQEAVRAKGTQLLLTPNPAESALILGEDPTDPPKSREETIVASRAAAERYECTVTLRGCTTGEDGKSWLDTTGGPGLATSGSGDVLAGMAAGLMARGCGPAQAAVWAARLHARCGERLTARVGPIGYLARELLDEAPRALVELAAGTP